MASRDGLGLQPRAEHYSDLNGNMTPHGSGEAQLVEARMCLFFEHQERRICCFWSF